MTIRNMIAAFSISVISACQTTTMAVDPLPWDLPKPEMTTVHQNSAIAARAVEEKLPGGNFTSLDLTQANWDYSNGRPRITPMSNMTVAELTSLITGKYLIQTDEGQNHDFWHARYYAQDGTSHFCGYNDIIRQYEEWTLDRYVATTGFGLAGTFHWDPKLEATSVPPEKNGAWPMVADSDRGLLFSYYYEDKNWIARPGWIQKEYAAAFAVHCPNLPRVSTVNNNQRGDTFADLILEATPVRGFRTAFKNNPENPLTAGMYYWLYPPE